MAIQTLEIHNFRIYQEATLELDNGFTVIYGENGQGKTSLLEAISWIAGQGSFRGVTDDTLIRNGASAAIIRATTINNTGRNQQIDVEIPVNGRNRVQINGQGLRRKADLHGIVPVTIFSPDDLELVKGSPAERRRWLDDSAASISKSHEALRTELERIVKQRNALLRSCAGKLGGDETHTLDVWDARLAQSGEQLRHRRQRLLAELTPQLTKAYESVAGKPAAISAVYQPSWQGELAEALQQARSTDLRRAITTVGPHRDEIALHIGQAPARTHGSQGEQRSLVLAMRLATDALIRQSATTSPILLLDDVFSELDNRRAEALLHALPEGQRLLTTATEIPAKANPDRLLKVTAGTITETEIL